jgi:hypothetical protein
MDASERVLLSRIAGNNALYRHMQARMQSPRVVEFKKFLEILVDWQIARTEQ